MEGKGGYYIVHDFKLFLNAYLVIREVKFHLRENLSSYASTFQFLIPYRLDVAIKEFQGFKATLFLDLLAESFYYVNYGSSFIQFQFQFVYFS